MPEAEISVLVCMSDSGGSTGDLRQMFNTPPVGDLRKSISALCVDKAVAQTFERRYSPDNSIYDVEMSGSFMRELLQDTSVEARDAFDGATEVAKVIGDVQGHTYGNFVLTALARQHDIDYAAAQAGHLLNIRGKVIPITNTVHDLQMEDGDTIIQGEHAIDEYCITDPYSARISLSPDAPLNPTAERAILDADAVLVAPGSVFTSLGAALVTSGTSAALQKMTGRLVNITNLVTQGHETRGWDAAAYANKLQEFMGRPFDFSLCNVEPLPGNDMQVEFDRERFRRQVEQTVAIEAALVERQIVEMDPNDRLAHTRSTMRHNPEAIAEILNLYVL